MTKYRIKQHCGSYQAQKRFLFDWVDFGYYSNNLREVLNQIDKDIEKKQHKPKYIKFPLPEE